MIWNLKIRHGALVYHNPAMADQSWEASFRLEPQQARVFYTSRRGRHLHRYLFHAFGVSFSLIIRKDPETWADLCSRLSLRLANSETAITFERNRCAAIAAHMQGRSADDIARAIMAKAAE